MCYRMDKEIRPSIAKVLVVIGGGCGTFAYIFGLMTNGCYCYLSLFIINNIDPSQGVFWPDRSHFRLAFPPLHYSYLMFLRRFRLREKYIKCTLVEREELKQDKTTDSKRNKRKEKEISLTCRQAHPRIQQFL